MCNGVRTHVPSRATPGDACPTTCPAPWKGVPASDLRYASRLAYNGGMAAPRRDTRDRMIRSAARVFQRQGFVGAGLRDILEEAQAPRGSFYFHFPGGKEELGVEAAAFWRDNIVSLTDRCAARAQDAAEFVSLSARALATAMERSGFVEGCPVAVTALEMAHASEPLRNACDAMLQGWQEALRRHLLAAGLDDNRASSLATLGVSMLEGALIVSRTGLSAKPLLVAGEELSALVRVAASTSRPRVQPHAATRPLSSRAKRAAAIPA